MGTEPHRSEGVATTGVALKTTDSRHRSEGVATTGVALKTRNRTGSRLDKSLDSVNP